MHAHIHIHIHTHAHIHVHIHTHTHTHTHTFQVLHKHHIHMTTYAREISHRPNNKNAVHLLTSYTPTLAMKVMQT
jgi:hypothetical protein